ncbi:hypothetical protein PFISCL1PPCAC_7044, partial [Pristionchus fissidentatus]
VRRMREDLKEDEKCYAHRMQFLEKSLSDVALARDHNERVKQRFHAVAATAKQVLLPLSLQQQQIPGRQQPGLEQLQIQLHLQHEQEHRIQVQLVLFAVQTLLLWQQRENQAREAQHAAQLQARDRDLETLQTEMQMREATIMELETKNAELKEELATLKQKNRRTLMM